jgi:hypothetical protein
MTRIALPALLGIVLASPVAAQHALTPNTLRLAPGQSSPPATIADMAWLTGHWLGEGLGGHFEEVWTAPKKGVMLGLYRGLKDDAPVFYEILTISEVSGSLEVRLRHFNPDLKGWEEKDQTVAMPFVARRDGLLHFDGMAFKPEGPDAVTVYLAIEDRKTGKPPREVVFQYRRVKP